MFLFVILLFFSVISLGMHNNNHLSVLHEPTALSLNSNDDVDIVIDHQVSSEEDLSEVVLSTFMRKTDANVAKYIKPHLVSVIKQVADSPESDDDDSPSPHKVIRSWVKRPDSIKNTLRSDLDEVILSAVEKAFEEKEKLLEKKEKKIEGMFSKKSTALITTLVTAVVTVASSLGSVYGTKDINQNCTK
jgi:hypothetical protein